MVSGGSIALHSFAETDITPEYLSWLNDPVTMRYSNQRFRRHDGNTSLEYLRSFASSGNLFVSVRLKSDGRMIGTMTAYIAAPHGTADMGLLIGEREMWGRGLGLEAWSLLMEHLLDAHALRKVTGGALRCNVAMVRIMERSGMHLEGARMAQELVDGEPQDVLYFAKFH